jgi:NAD(P)-dependent dehydrogenase (short-subunit alcohol dehydrogenase family)
MELQGRTALVTGAGVRLGKEIALALAGRGVNVAVHYYRSADAAAATAREIEALGCRAVAVGADLSDTAQLDDLVGRCVGALGPLDILINSASIFERGTVFTETVESFDRHLAVNLKAPFFLTQAFARRLGPEQRGHIINLTDWRALRPGTQYMAYTLAKAGLVAMTKSLALGLAPRVQVNAIAPGAILAPPGDPGDYFARLAERLPLRHVGSPREITLTVLYLLDSDFVTGEVVHVTGGEQL